MQPGVLHYIDSSSNTQDVRVIRLFVHPVFR